MREIILVPFGMPTVDATYPGLSPAPAAWATEPVDNEPVFAGGVTLATDSGLAPPWV